MNTENIIWKELQKNNFMVSTDTRKDLSGTIYFGLKGDNFDGNDFVKQALKKGAKYAVTDNSKNNDDKVFVVKDVTKTLQEMAKRYRQTFKIPIIVIGGSNGKTTSKDLLRDVLKTKYRVHSTEGSFNNHFGVPLSILSMKKNTEIGLFEIGANHPKEHNELLKIVQPTHTVVTNNGMDHLEGFKTPAGSRKANKEIYDWAFKNKALVFVNKKQTDLVQDSEKNRRILYSNENLKIISETPLILKLKNTKYKTCLVGDYNIENIGLALAIGKYFKIEINTALKRIGKYIPLSKRSQYLEKEENYFVVDCYNANPSSMILALESFVRSNKSPRGIILGDMLELGKYTESEHGKIIDWIKTQKFDCVVFVGSNFKKIMKKNEHLWFENSTKAGNWFKKQNFKKYTFLLKGSRGMKIEQVIENIK